MTRNLYERCEVLFPVLDKHLAKRLREEILEAYLKDNLKARILQPDGTYTRHLKNGHHPFSAQEHLMALASEEVTEIPAKIAAKKADKKAQRKLRQHHAKEAHEPEMEEEETIVEFQPEAES